MYLILCIDEKNPYIQLHGGSIEDLIIECVNREFFQWLPGIKKGRERFLKGYTTYKICGPDNEAVGTYLMKTV